MASKMYYNEQEAADLLGISAEELAQFVRDQRLQVFKDGDKNMYKGDEVEALAASSGGGEVDLLPAELGDADPMARTTVDTNETAADLSLGDADPMARTTMDFESGGDAVTLSDADDIGSTGGKEDTVITAEGISIFDEEDLEIETADPMAKTQMAPSLEDQIALDGVGSGSGLLDLTQESDDTSLGAELLDHIDIEEPAEPVSFDGSDQPPVVIQPVATELVIDSSNVTEAPDATSGLFAGVLVGCAAVAMLVGAVAIAGITDIVPEYIETLSGKLTMVMGVAVAFALVAGGLGLMLGKATASRRM
ncbi:MAG: helix-turn-helix domain-containing protein [Phycisphaerae bacterium]|nr:helix-turn-helix domain-containing protein [Planctomycetota bacterium]MBL7219241.1 helix-turn-helix domain-containing protein [Phycisphaerae bacterium]